MQQVEQYIRKGEFIWTVVYEERGGEELGIPLSLVGVVYLTPPHTHIDADSCTLCRNRALTAFGISPERVHLTCQAL